MLHDAEIRRQIRAIFLETRNATFEAVGSVPNGDVKTPLKSLHKAGYQLAILTNDSEKSARQSCDDIGILPYINMIVGFDSGFGSKPGPNGLIAICETLNITPAEAAMVGDTYADFGAANSAGAGLFIGISDIYPDCPDALKAAAHLLPDLSGLPSLLARRSN